MPDKAEELQEKIKIYSQALEDIKVELTSRRSEMAELTRQTIEDLDARIPQLRKKAQEMDAKIVELDKQIKERERTAAQEQQSYAKFYSDLEEGLKKKFDALYLSLNKESAEAKNLLDENNKRVIELNELQRILYEKQRILDGKELSLIAKKDQMDAFLKEESEKIKKSVDLINLEKSGISILEANLKAKEANLNHVIKQAEAEKLEAEKVVKRIAEAQAILDEANNVKDANVKKEDELNQLKVKLMADTARNNRRSDELNAREVKLNERDANLKILEAKV